MNKHHHHASAGPLGLDLTGITCAGCVRRTEKAIAAVPGVTSAEVNFATRRAEVHGTATPAEIVQAIEAAGYGVREERHLLSLEGMSCASCVSRIEQALRAVPGVLGADVNFATRQANVRALPDVGHKALEAAIAGAGYSVAGSGDQSGHDHADHGAHDHAHMHDDEEAGPLARRVFLALMLALPVVVLEMGTHVSHAFHAFVEANIGMQTSRIAQFVLTLAILAGPGRIFLEKGVPALLRGAPEMNSLVAVGTGAAFLYSTVATFVPGVLPPGTDHIYFEAAAVIVTLILIGRWLEARARGRTGAAIKRLIGLAPKEADVVRDGRTLTVPVSEINVGDLVLARPGQRIATDGVVVEGSSRVDESMITGEPVPIAKSVDDHVTGGTVNTTGSITYRAERVGADTALAQIIRMVQEAQGAKAPIQALVDRVTAVFVPIVLVVALLTFLAWFALGPEGSLPLALVNAVAVLIIACPCAMGLATPTSIMVGTGRAADLGVLFRRSDALQGLANVDLVAFDKTGTLTIGRPVLTDLLPAAGVEDAEALRLLASVEALSEHPSALAVVEAARAREIALPPAGGFEAISGAGIRGEVEGRRIVAGSARLMADENVDISALAAEAERLGREGKSPFYLAVDGQAAAVVAVADEVRPTAHEAIAELHRLDIRTAMITGDDARTANAIAARLGVDQVFAEASPADKVDVLKRLHAGGRTGFVGDGINDAPVLAAADIGIAIGTGTDVAIESADVVLMGGDPALVATAIGVSRAVLRNIKQNLFWAFAYNVLLIPVAAGLLYPLWGVLLSPMLAAGAMALSSVFVLANALRLTRAGHATAPQAR